MPDQLAKLHLENQLCFPLYAASRLTTKIYMPFLKKLDLTYPQYLVLLVLWQLPEQTVNEIGNKLMLESNTLTPLLKRLEQKKLIQRTRSQRDERSVLVSLTPEGTSLRENAVAIPDQIIASFQDQSISQEEGIAFRETLKKLLTVLEEKTRE
ncbi:MarR family transcriptional regulator [Algoriphagus aestuariicola]|uniref:HTH-type transcriptional regulator SarZ n=1 Tax=Algoriphagus aestuariicola TaxID=1852016 RepID=A0ABS3BZ12_9BACT|nr:MarR family transcriptional regulator [Algoriphagus aestuariicola]MBN7803556.1 MarR family transcriptional regulator [Algoriphagus aestuariicola]